MPDVLAWSSFHIEAWTCEIEVIMHIFHLAVYRMVVNHPLRKLLGFIAVFHDPDSFFANRVRVRCARHPALRHQNEQTGRSCLGPVRQEIGGLACLVGQSARLTAIPSASSEARGPCPPGP
jgi:hypothetical protein